MKSRVSGVRMSLHPCEVRDQILGRVREAPVAAMLMRCKFRELLNAVLVPIAELRKWAVALKLLNVSRLRSSVANTRGCSHQRRRRYRRHLLSHQRHRAIPGLGLATRIVGIGHDANADQRARRLAKNHFKVSLDVALIVQPAAQMLWAGLKHQLANSVRV